MDEEYLKLFGPNQNNRHQEQQWENLNSKPGQQWEKLNETPNNNQYNINENLNEGWGTLDVQIESRVNGIQQNQRQPYYGNRRRRGGLNGPNLNGLDAFLDDDEDLREVVKTPKLNEIMSPPQISQNISDVDIVSIDLFESVNTNALLTLANKKVGQIDPSKVTNSMDDRKITFLGS